jgi:hypothetical protein
MFLGDYVQLITRESCLELLDFSDATGTKRNTCRLVELAGKVCLKKSFVLNDTLVLWIFVQLCFGHHNCVGTTEIIFVFYLNYASFFRQITFEVHNITLTTGTSLRHFHMDHIDVDRVV